MRIEPLTLAGLAEVLGERDESWDGRDTRFLHQRVFVHEFGDTCLAARGNAGSIGFTSGSASRSHGRRTTRVPARPGSL
jgi:hypothetical protein